MRQESLFDLFDATLSLHKADSRVFNNIRAHLSGNKIIIPDALLPIEIGDKLTRVLPNGLTDKYLVDECSYQEAIDEFPARFHLTVHRTSSVSSAATASASAGSRVARNVIGQESPPPDSAQQAEKPIKARPGPKRNLELALQVRGIVERVAGIGPWKPKLDEICDALDEAQIKTPKTWKGRSLDSWADAAALERELAKKAIKYHLVQCPTNS